MGRFTKILSSVLTVGALWLAGVMFPIPRTTEARDACTGAGGFVSLGMGRVWCHMS